MSHISYLTCIFRTLMDRMDNSMCHQSGCVNVSFFFLFFIRNKNLKDSLFYFHSDLYHSNL